MKTAGIADVNGTLLNAVARTTVRRTAVDGMLIIETPAGRVQLEYLVAHDG